MKQTYVSWVVFTATWSAAALVGGCGMGQATVAPSEGGLAIINAVSPSIAHVEYTLQYDKGEGPNLQGRFGMPRFGFGGPRGYYGETNQYIKEERPMESQGFLVGPTKVVVSDLMVHPRFIKKIEVRFGEDLVAAKTAAYAKDRPAMMLELARPFKGAEPMKFNAKAERPYLSVNYFKRDAVWTVNVGGGTAFEEAKTVALTEHGKLYSPGSMDYLITDRKGAAVAIGMKTEGPLDDSWKGSPLGWPWIDAQRMDDMLKAAQRNADGCLLRVKLNFRSPRKKTGADRWRYRRDDGRGSETERNVVGVVFGEKNVLVAARLKPNVTARLERITVYPVERKPVKARFTHTLTDYGCLVAETKKPLGSPAKLSTENVLDYRDQVLMYADVRIQGEKRVTYFGHQRISGYGLGWKRHVKPMLSGGSHFVYVFDPHGALLLMPVMRRKKVTVKEESWDYDAGGLVPGVYLNEVLTSLDKSSDPNNVPLSEEEENRVAWMGVELQNLGRELARANNVSDLTRDGSTGALITHVYKNSPAEKAGIKPGVILLRLHVEGHPKPLEVKAAAQSFGGGMAFPWARLDALPEQYFDQLPKPWPSVESQFNMALTELGFGKKYKAEFFSDGKSIFKEFAVAQSPKHYDSAPRYKSKGLGLTVRDLTFEVRRYFQKTPEDPGVIISKIEPGSKASVSGIKPYEIITHVNDTPVKAAKDLEKLESGKSELRLSVLRMTRRRLVKIKMKKPAEKKGGGAKKAGKKPPAEPKP